MSEGRSWFFIVNPAAGRGKAVALAEKLRNEILKTRPYIPIVYTLTPGHAGYLAADYFKKGYESVGIIGGDGTLNEVLQIMPSFKDKRIAALPGGSGNDFISLLGWNEFVPKRDLGLLFESPHARVDIGRCNGRYFINGIGIGFDAEVAWRSIKSRMFVGATKYYWAIIKELFLYREQRMQMRLGRHVSDELLFFITIGLGRSYGGGFRVTPKAVLDDGLFDLCLVNEASIFQRISKIYSMLKGRHLNDPIVNYFHSKKLFLEFKKPVKAHIDGELFKAERFDIELIPRAVSCVVHPNLKEHNLFINNSEG